MTSALFASDMHLQDADEATARWFLDSLRAELKPGDLVVLLGDLFEYWVGDDQPSAMADALALVLRHHAEAGGQCAIMHGNRDFLIGQQYCQRAGVRLLPDPCILEIAGTSILLAHGDSFCVDDVEYQKVRTEVRTPAWQLAFLSSPLQERLRFARQQRGHSEQHKKAMPEKIMDVSAQLMSDLGSSMQQHGLACLVHGHTHRPAHHLHDEFERWVLPDWHFADPQRGGFLRLDHQGFHALGPWAKRLA